jgi:hypothetical protein
MDVLVSPVLVEDGALMLVPMRITRDDDDNVDGSATCAYVAKIGLAGRRTVDAAWLDRHSGPSLLILERLACVGLAVAEEDEDEGTIGPRDDDNGGAIVVGGSRWIRTPGSIAINKL